MPNKPPAFTFQVNCARGGITAGAAVLAATVEIVVGVINLMGKAEHSPTAVVQSHANPR
jgi:hypothetical protein